MGLSCAGADRLQTGMRGAYGKPIGTVARVNIGQVIMSIRTTDKFKASAIEAFRRAKFKFPGRQTILVSDKWGFTKWLREDYPGLKESGRITNDGFSFTARMSSLIRPLLTTAVKRTLAPTTARVMSTLNADHVKENTDSIAPSPST